MSAESDYVALSKQAAITVQYLNFDTRVSFVDAVNNALSVNDVAEPYRSWIKKPDSVPNEKRSQRFKKTKQTNAVKSDGTGRR